MEIANTFIAFSIYMRGWTHTHTYVYKHIYQFKPNRWKMSADRQRRKENERILQQLLGNIIFYFFLFWNTENKGALMKDYLAEELFLS